MTTVLDLFSSPHFAMRRLIDAINVVPNVYGRINQLGLMPMRGLATTYVEIEYKNGVLNLLPTRPRGAPPTLAVRGQREKRVFPIPHIPHADALLAVDIQNRVPFGAQDAVVRLVDFMNEKLADMSTKHFITLEHLRFGALKGLILDADGSTLYDLFTEYGIAQKVVDFALDVTTTDVGAKNMEVLRHMEDNLMGEQMTDVHALVSPEFFDAYTSHQNVKDAYDKYASQQNMLREDVRRGFRHKGITFEEHRGTAPYLNPDGSTTIRRFIAAGEAHFFPLGTVQTFTTYVAPPDALSEANQTPRLEQGQWIFAAQERMKFDKGIEIYTESNVLPLCKRPQLLVKGTI